MPKKRQSRKNKKIFVYFNGFFIVLLFAFLFGLSFVNWQDYLGATESRLRSIKFYSSNTVANQKSDNYKFGWWGDLADVSQPQISPKGDFADFSENNSVFYKGGDYTLSFSGFFPEGDKSDYFSTDNLENISDNQIASSTDASSTNPFYRQNNTGQASTSASTTADVSKIFKPSIALAGQDSDFSILGELQSVKINFSMALKKIRTEPQKIIKNATSSNETVSTSTQNQPPVSTKTNLSSTSSNIISSNTEDILLDNNNDLDESEQASSTRTEDLDFSSDSTSSPSKEIQTKPKDADVDSKEQYQEVEIIEEDNSLKEVEVVDSSENTGQTPEVEENSDSDSKKALEEKDDFGIEDADNITKETVKEDISSEKTEPEKETETKKEETENTENKTEESNDEPDNSDEDLISRIFGIQKAVAGEMDPKFNIWYSTDRSSVASSSSSTEKVWKKLDTITADNLSNFLNKGFFSYEADFVDNWSDLENLEIKIEGLSSGEADFVFYLDGIWLEVEYEKNENSPELPKEKEIRWDNMLELLSEKKVFAAGEKGDFKFRYHKNRNSLLGSIGDGLGLSSYWSDVDIRVELQNFKEEVYDLPLVLVFEEDGEFSLKLPEMPREFRPGQYKIKFYIEDQSGDKPEEIILEEKFYWGVLAMNTDKSIYNTSDDSAFIQMAVLDEGGHTICDADLNLEIISPDGSARFFDTADERIIRNEFCGPDNVIDSPDYYMYFQLEESGEYLLNLEAETENGVKNISDSFRVVDDFDFSIKREGPTRIYPLADYEMDIEVLANRSFAGSFYEYLPEDFLITEEKLQIKKSSSTDFVDYDDFIGTSSEKYSFEDIIINGEKEISWSNLEMEQGDTLRFTYVFDAPNISPELYLLGPATIATTTEERRWQIASDAISTYDGDNGSAVGWTSAASAWDSTNNTYAFRDIPRKNVDDSSNYLLLTSNTATDIGGDITSVEVAIEGYVENTSVTTFFVPVLGGSDGSTYSITGTTMGTTDNDTPVYTDITSELATWTWTDIVNMDIRLYGQNSANNSPFLLNIDQISIRVDYTTNNAPTGSFNSALQKTNNSGAIDISVEADDIDGDDVRAKLEYSSGTSCDFSTSSDPSLDENGANISADFGTVLIDNLSEYQVGTSTGLIKTASGSNSVAFDWLSKDDVPGVDGDYCLRLTVNDFTDSQAVPATTTVSIDNAKPSQPGALGFDSHAKNSLTLSFGATSSDSNFEEYKIYWKEYDGTAPTETDNENSSSTDINLAAIDFNGASTTTISGLTENTQYSFSLWAYDIYGHKASSSFASFYTNQAPTSSFNSAIQRSDGSGVVDISLDVDDGDNDNSIARVDYASGATCDFSTPLDPTLDETQSNISTTYGVPTIDNTRIYQIGEPGWYITTPDVNTLQFDWLGQNDLSGLEGNYCLQFTMNDGEDDQNSPATSTLMIDNKAPTSPGSLFSAEVTASSIKLLFGTSSTDLSFSHYKIFYKKGTSSVSESDNEHIDADLNDIAYNGTASTTVGGLDLDSDYVFNIWAYDSYGNKSSSTEITAKTNSSVTNDSLVFTNPDTLNHLIADGASEWNFRASVSDLGGYTEIDTVILRLADSFDSTSPFSDLEFSWSETNGSFTENGSDANAAVTISPNATSSCALNTCTIDFSLVFGHTFASSTLNYSAELYSTNDSAAYDSDTYIDFYQVLLKRMEQVHYRWRNDDGGE